ADLLELREFDWNRGHGDHYSQQHYRQPGRARDEQPAAAQARIGSAVLLKARRVLRCGIWQSHANILCLLLILRTIRLLLVLRYCSTTRQAHERRRLGVVAALRATGAGWRPR